LFAPRVGKPDNLLYAAPELLRRGSHQTQKPDIWALGILLCVMATGAFPFRGTDERKIARQIRCGRLKYPRNMDREVDDSSKTERPPEHRRCLGGPIV
jgi:serine/threonine protein kinase